MHLRRSKINISDRESDARFSSVKPYSEGIMRRGWNTATKWVLRVTAATMLLTSVGNFYSCTDTKSVAAVSQNPPSQEDLPNNEVKTDVIQNPPTTQEETVSKLGKTDQNGKASFEVNGKTYEINIVDGETGNPISGLDVLLFLQDNSGFYVILDPTGIYLQKIASLGESVEEKADDGSDFNKKIAVNVVLSKKDVLCTPANKLFSNVDFSSEEDMQNLEKWHNAWKTNSKVKNPLTTAFAKEEKESTLAELNDVLKQIIEIYIEDAALAGIGEAPVQIAIYLGAKQLAKTITSAFKKLTYLEVLDYCAVLEYTSWAGYYEGLCYEPGDKFEIWKLKPIPDIEVAGISLLTNPLFIILPVEKKNDWSAPTATIQGTVKIEGADKSTKYPDVELKHVEGKLPTISNNDLFSDSTSFSFVASACLSINPTYELSVRKGQTFTNYGDAKLTLTVTEGEEYTVDFNLESDCANYSTTSTSQNVFDVTCKPEAPVKKDCNGEPEGTEKEEKCENEYGLRKVKCENGAWIKGPCDMKCKLLDSFSYGYHFVDIDEDDVIYLTTDSNTLKYLNLSSGLTELLPSSYVYGNKTLEFEYYSKGPILSNGKVAHYTESAVVLYDINAKEFKIIESSFLFGFSYNKLLYGADGCAGQYEKCYGLLDLTTNIETLIASPIYGTSFYYPWLVGEYEEKPFGDSSEIKLYHMEENKVTSVDVKFQDGSENSFHSFVVNKDSLSFTNFDQSGKTIPSVKLYYIDLPPMSPPKDVSGDLELDSGATSFISTFDMDNGDIAFAARFVDSSTWPATKVFISQKGESPKKIFSFDEYSGSYEDYGDIDSLAIEGNRIVFSLGGYTKSIPTQIIICFNK